MAEQNKPRIGMTPENAIEIYNMHSDNKLKRIRVSKGLSQQALANASGVTKRMIQSYEQGQRKIDNALLESICDLCITLDCKIEDILEDEGLLNKFKLVK